MSGSDENPRRTRHATDRETMAAPRDAGAPRRRRGRRAPTNFEREMRTMAASVRQLAQHQAQMQGYIQTMHMQRNHPQGEDFEDPDEEHEVNSRRPRESHDRGEASNARTYANDDPHVDERGPQPTVSASVFQRLGEHGPRDRPRVSHQRREPLGSPPRNRRERRAREAEARAESEYRPYQPPQDPYYQPPQGSYHQPRHLEEGQQAQNPFPPPVPECPKETRSYEVDDDDENLPFSEGIRNAPIPHEFRVPKITPYTGKGDPLNHVNTYKTEMTLRGANPALKCRAFHLTLSGGAKRWYNKLAAGSIHNWPDLKRTFINYFSSRRPASAPVQRLHDIRQAESEPLQSYLSRFNEEMLFCETITDAEALSALKGGLDMNHPFWRDVRNKNPTTFDQLVEMIMEEITNENMILHRNRGGVAPNQVPRVNYGKTQVRHLPQPPRRRDYPADPNAGMSYVASAQEGLLPPYPVQMAPGSSTGAYNYGVAVPTYYETGTGSLPILPPRQETPSKYCLVHRSHGHSTEECREVVNLANRRETNSGPRRGASTRRGMQSPMHHRRPQGPDRRSQQWDRQPADQDPPRRNSRSPGGQSRNAQKSYAKEAEGKLEMNWLINSRPSSSSKVDPISFTEEDMKGVHYPHCDALLVRAVVARNGLGRMLVDNGSSVNVIFSSTYEQMNIDVPLEPSTEPLYGFTGDCVTPKGIIRLAVTMGEEPLAAHTFMEFLVVDRRSAYHGVLGRPTLKELWAVTSIHHLCMKFSTEGGIATVRGQPTRSSEMLQKCLEKG
ncbi:Ribonuclease H [Abeliophyllum distichum]|uniref:Ribonuclease H n=1 Tax=Abeliophyllum distichum TaxID=126358 RepID=A0ABD1V850_9LAMI